jgi:hypothetical protein
MSIVDQKITIDTSMVEKEGILYFYVGMHGFPCTVERFKELMNGSITKDRIDIDPEHIIRNAAINATLSDVKIDMESKDKTGLSDLKAVIEAATFKV